MRNRKRLWIFLYLAVLGVSWIVMSTRHQPLPQSGNWQEMKIPGKDGKPAALRYRKFPGANSGLPPVVLLHGSPMASSGFDPLLEKLPRDRTILVPDLPGFGESSTGFSDLSFTGHAEALERLMDHEKVSSAHWVAYSQGGGPALELSARRPAAFTSLTLLSSIGAQEYELTGDYFLNHVLHGAQWILLEALRWGVPHFGLLDRFLLNTRYARNFYEGDMRPLRARLKAFAAPALIIHGNEDGLVIPGAARESHRLIPQSRIVWMDGGHMVVMSRASAVAEELTRFFTEVDAGQALQKSQAQPARLQEAKRTLDPAAMMRLAGPALWLTLLGIALATLASEDLACLAAGLLVARGLIPLPAGIGASFAGIWLGDMALYAAGRYGGTWCLKRAPLRWMITARHLEAGRSFLTRRGGMAILASRFMPGTRLPLYVAAGIVKVPAVKLAWWFLLAGLLWAIPVVSLAAIFGERMSDWLLHRGAAVFPIALLLLFVAWLLLRLGTSFATHRGRRLLLSKWQRLVRWEFWPPWIFYPPVILAAIAMGVRRRSLLAFTAANPAIPHGGIAGESKTAILTHLLPSGNVGSFVSVPASAEDKPVRVSKWRAGAGFPLVVKPDQGERGSGVAIVHDQEELARELESREVDTIVQTYLEGAEFGVFYIRHPQEENGRIFSVTLKIMTAVTGDGTRTLEELILDDDRAFLSQRHFREIHQDRLEDIPAAGETVTLARLGSHCRGSLFLNGSHLITPALEAEIDRIARTFEGFYFGRFDLRCADEESFKRGENLRIIELNGVTSEATHIYHPHTPLLTGYRTLISQWRHAYDIGTVNAARGAKVSTWKEFATLLSAHFRSNPH